MKHRYKSESVFCGKPMSIEQYRDYKINLLKTDFEIDLTNEEVAHICSLDTIFKIDHYCRSILQQRWSDLEEEEDDV